MSAYQRGGSVNLATDVQTQHSYGVFSMQISTGTSFAIIPQITSAYDEYSCNNWFDLQANGFENIIIAEVMGCLI